jgi:DNA (cytosine-5)-methyltransferase 1
VAWHPLGWAPAWFSEIEDFPSRVLAHHYPEVPNLGDMTTLAARVLAGEVEAPPLLVGGTPCQAFSLAGLRGSLSDARGNLTLSFVELADAIDAVRSRRGERACWVLWENVPGVFTVEDNAFGCFLGGLVGADAPLDPPRHTGWTNAGVVAGPRRTAAWRVLDAQHLGVAQRRRRVFVLARGGAGNWDAAEALLPLLPSVRRHPAPRRAARAGAAGAAPRGAPDLGVPGVAGCLEATSHDWSRSDVSAFAMIPEVAGCLQERDYKGADSDTKPGHLIPAVNVFGEDVAPPLMHRSSRGGAQTLSPGHQTDGHMLVQPIPAPFVFKPSHYTRDKDGAPSSVCPPLTREADKGDQDPVVCAPIPFDTTQITHPENRSRPEPGDPSPTLAKSGHAPAIAFSVVPEGGQGADLRAAQVDLAPALASRNEARPGAGYDRGVRMVQTMAVRRLTETECERLQGFPDGYTNIPKATASARYAALGNSMATTVMAHIGKGIQRVEDAHAAGGSVR